MNHSNRSYDNNLLRPAMPSLQANFVARIEKLPIKKEMAGLLPVFEAISNSLHAIEARFKSEHAAKGQIIINIIRDNDKENSPIKGFIIKDNGIGLTKDNYQSFLSIDSTYKAKIGGKGVGRLCWLKIFETLHIESAYFDLITNKLEKRSFDFLLQETDQIQNVQSTHNLEEPSTIILLQGYKPPYISTCPIKGSTIRENILKHFFHYFLNPAPQIYVKDIDGTFILNDDFNHLIKDRKEEETSFNIVRNNDDNQIEEETHKLLVKHILMSKHFRPNQKGNSKFNRIFLTAHNRMVSDDFIDAALGLTVLQDDNIYICCVSGEYLDNNVNSERTGFIFDEDIKKLINKTVLETSKRFLACDLDKLKKETYKIIKSEIEDYPQFNFIRNNMDDFMGVLKPGKIDRESIFVEMCRYRRRRTKQMSRLKTEIYNSDLKIDKTVEKKFQEYKEYINNEQKGLLAEYI